MTKAKSKSIEELTKGFDKLELTPPDKKAFEKNIKEAMKQKDSDNKKK